MDTLREYQQGGIRWLRESERGGILADEMGLGKTAQAILAAEGRTLILAPALVVDARIWQKEIKRVRPGWKPTIVSYHSLVERHRTEKGGYTLTDRPKASYTGPYDTLILDECHNIKNRKTTYSAAVQRIKANKVFLLTGTPIPNWAHEVYMPLRLLHDQDDRRFSSYWRWIEGWFKVSRNRYTDYNIGGLLKCTWQCDRRPLHLPCVHWQAFILGNGLDSLMLRRERKDVLTELPPLQQEDIELKMTPTQARHYQEMKREFTVHLPEGPVHAWSAASAFVSCLRLATGVVSLHPEYTPRGRSRWQSNKMDWLSELMLARRDEPTIIFAVYQNTLRAIWELARQHNIPRGLVYGKTPRPQRVKAIHAFQEGKIPLLIGSPKVLGEGLNLQRASVAVFVEHAWVPSLNEQAVGRLHRMGQTNPVQIYHLWSRHSVDIHHRKLLQKKNDQQIRAMTAQDLLTSV